MVNPTPVYNGSAPSNPSQMKDRYDACVRALDFELEQFWKRSLFFWGFIGAAFVALGTIHNRPIFQSAIASFGFVASIAWTLANRGSKYWYEDWEDKLIKAEEPVTGRLYALPGPERGDSGWFSAKRYSPSRLTIALSTYTMLFWMAVVLYRVVQFAYRALSTCFCGLSLEEAFALGFMLFSCAFGLSLFRFCRAKA